ncbi:hypothetical protein NECAME_17445 [Necator americanus]|uniref:Uncharacterized protein n=1 Tax=Necator americanus TaxID=51031 RepID=W2TR57_NECAM|nr:hypothetical protein NECAME_17445 [Necator americanus]ETN83522.1 hypothetical protein NECAME_17445 [Necator americanus]
MFRIIPVFLALTAFTNAVPPIVPVPVNQKPAKPKLIDPQLMEFEPITLEPAEPADKLNIHTEGVVARTYDDNFYPSCNNGRAKVSLPGIIRIMKGKVVVKAPSKITKSIEARMTITKNSRVLSTVCNEGVPLNGLVGKDKWMLSVIPVFLALTAFTNAVPPIVPVPIEATSGMGSFIKLPSINAAEKIFVKGDWKVVTALYSEGKAVARVKIPSNDDWIYVQ